ncbi:MAG: low-specificity L-threonine aldolase [Deltaproteobacteria bacterium]|nr:low-specificity L-threonine aldolase [Deltaproteobacteria bacterium]
MKVIDLRSDTVTRPTPAMRQAMAEAEVGDDVFGEDPTVNALQARSAALLGKEAALFVPSGTMANQLAIRTHTEPGDEVIIEGSSHPFNYEGGATAALSGVQFFTLPGRRGILEASQIEAAIRPPDHHYPRTRLVCLENTHNRGGGSIFPLEKILEIAGVARDRGLALHLDGARLFNACVATGIKPAEYARHFDSVSFCLSKGLGAPVGSLLAGSAAFIDRAHRFRKMFGGGMRQAGILAAAGLYALDHHIERLEEDHRHARLLAQGLAGFPGVEVKPEEVETNMVFVRVTDRPAAELARALREQGVLLLATARDTIRCVTHLDVSEADIHDALARITEWLHHAG